MAARDRESTYPTRIGFAARQEVLRSEHLVPVRVARRSGTSRNFAEDVYLERTSGFLSPLRIAKGLVTATIAMVAMGTAHYFNLFVRLDQDVHTALAQIDKELQRRADLVNNLLPPAFEYAALERQVFTGVAKVRAARPEFSRMLEEAARAASSTGESKVGAQIQGPIPLESLGEIMPRLLAVSEQYPDMKSVAPFELLMENLVEIENRLAEERRSYNDYVNFYTTKTASFPGKIFAELFEFHVHELFVAEPAARKAPKIEWPKSMDDTVERAGRGRLEEQEPER